MYVMAMGRLLVSLCVGAIAAFALEVSASVLITVEEALALAFPGAAADRETLFLDDEQMRRAVELCGAEFRTALVTRFVASRESEIVGYAYLDTHRVRTLAETLMVVIAPDGTVRRVEVVSFREPLDYLPNRSWYEQFEGRELGPELELKRDIRPITGATLTARSTTEAVRRALAVHTVVEEGGGGS